MKTFKHIWVILFLSLTISLYSTGHITKLLSHIVNVESTYYTADTQDTESSESLEEADPTFACTDISMQKFFNGKERFYNITCQFPASPYYSIWLPPDNA